MDLTSRSVAHTNANDATGSFMSKHSIALWQRLGKQEHVGSGTCVEIDGRLFIATAAHNFQDIPRGGTVTFLPGLYGSSHTPLKDIAHNYGAYGAKGTPDVAWIEIDPQSARESNVLGISLDVIKSWHTMRPDEEYGNYEVTGFPAGLSERISRLESKVWLIIYNTKPGKNTKSDDLVLDYAESAFRQLPGGERVLTPLPHPSGISGGGIWYTPSVKVTEVWSPSRCRLIGIATEYWERKREIVGLRIRHWLTFLLDDHPELRTSIKPALNRRSQ